MNRRRFAPVIEGMPCRVVPSTLLPSASVAASSDPPIEDPKPRPEPDPGPLPTEEPPIIIPPLPPSGPVGPG